VSPLGFIHHIRKYIDIMIYYEVVFSTRLVSLGSFKSLEFRAETSEHTNSKIPSQIPGKTSGENNVRLATPHKAPWARAVHGVGHKVQPVCMFECLLSQ